MTDMELEDESGPGTGGHGIRKWGLRHRETWS